MGPGKGWIPCMRTGDTDFSQGGTGGGGEDSHGLTVKKSLISHHRMKAIIQFHSSLPPTQKKSFSPHNLAVRAVKNRILGELPNCHQVLSRMLCLSSTVFVTGHSQRLNNGAGWSVVLSSIPTLTFMDFTCKTGVLASSGR